MLSVAVGLICTVGLVALALADPATALRAAPWLALLGSSCWAVFWRPQVEVDDGGVRLVNVLRTIDLPWPSIHAVDTKWSLTLDTAYGRFSGWAAPAPGRRHAFRQLRQDAAAIPPGSTSPTGIRPGDLPATSSGDAAMVIRDRWDRLRAAGYLDDPRLERDRAPVRWHVGTFAVGGALLVLGMLTVA